jgi:hypothetical protein
VAAGHEARKGGLDAVIVSRDRAFDAYGIEILAA